MLDSEKISALYKSAQVASLVRPAVVTPMAAILQDNPFAWYRMDDDAGADFIKDRGPNALNLIAATTPIGGSTLPGSLQGDSNTAHSWAASACIATSATSEGVTPFSNGGAIECWVRRSGTLLNSTLQMQQNMTDFFNLVFGATSISVTTFSSVNAVLSETFADNRWHHFIASVRFADTTMLVELYVDGVIAASATGARPTSATGAGTVGLNIGNVALDELVFYTSPLSPERVTMHFRAGRWLTERLYQSKLREGVALQFSTPTDTGGVVDQQQVSLRLVNTDHYWDQWRAKEVRGKLVHVHLLDEYTGEVQEYMFTGEITTWKFVLNEVQVTAESIAAHRLLSTVPALIVTSNLSVSSQANGLPIPIGMGAGVRLPSLYVKTRLTQADPEQYDYLFCRGNFGIQALYRNELGASERTDWELLLKKYRVGGIYCTAVRFTLPQIDRSITATGQRAYPDVDDSVQYEWKWLSGFIDDIAQLPTRPPEGVANPLTTGKLTIGPTGIGLGAIELTKQAGDYLTTDSTVAVQTGAFTVELWLNPKPPAEQMGIPRLIVGPNSAPVVDEPSWEVVLDNGNVAWNSRTGAGVSSREISVPVESNRWTYVAFVRTREGVTLVYKDAFLVASAVSSPIVYQATPTGFNFFQKPGDGRVNRYAGLFGYCRISTTNRDQSYILKSYRMMRRNFVALLREVIEIDLNDQVDDDSFRRAEIAVDNIPTVGAGLLCCDGWVTQPIDGRTVIQALSRLRDFRLMRNSFGRVAIEVVKPGAIVQMRLSSGPPENNVVNVDGLVTFSLSEAINKMPVWYQQARDITGQPTGTGFSSATTAPAEVLPVGRLGDPWELPFVYSHRTADIIRDFTSKRLRLRDGAIALTVNHEARYLRMGHIAHLKLPTLVDYESDVEVMSAELHGAVNALTVCAYNESPFTYEPLPKLPPEPTALDIQLPAKNPFMVLRLSAEAEPVTTMYKVGSNQSFTWDVLIGDVETLLASGDYWTYLPGYAEVPNTGVPTTALRTQYDEHVLEINAGDGIAPAGLFFSDFDAPTNQAAVDVVAVVYEASVSCPDLQPISVPTPGAFQQYLRICSRPGTLSGGDGTGSQKFDSCVVTRFPDYGPFSNVIMQAIDLRAQTGHPAPNDFDRWAYDNAIGAEGGVFAYAHAKVDYLVKRIYPRIETHKYFGGVRIWRSSTSREFPPDDTKAFITLQGQLIGIEDGNNFPNDQLDRWWYYFVRVYDTLGREIGRHTVSVWVEARNPLPQLFDTAPAAADNASGPTQITINGYGFLQGAMVIFGTGEFPCIVDSYTQIRFTLVPSAYSPATYNVKVRNPDRLESNTVEFTIY